MEQVTLQPAAGAHGELTGILMVRAYHRSRGDLERTEVIVPDSSHGTNPATASIAGFRTVTVRSNERGGVDLDALRAALGPKTAAVMLTNPSTLGLFESEIVELLEAVHAVGALAYMDGANLNAVLGKFKPGAAGFDVMHFNVHKTFSTPHGGGGPGGGPVGVGEKLVPFLPAPRVIREGEGADASYRLERHGERPTSIGRVRAYQGNVGILVRAYAYISAHGAEGLVEVTEDAVLAATTSGSASRGPTRFPTTASASTSSSPRRVRSRPPAACARWMSRSASSTTASTRRPSTSRSSSRRRCSSSRPRPRAYETLDAFAAALLAIAEEARVEPDTVKSAPHTAPVRRLDEATAASSGPALASP